MTETGKLTISAVLATRGRGERLQAVLLGLLAQEALEEVIVVLDGTEDASFEVARELASHDARLKPLWVSHRGQFGALHAGIEAASSDVIWILDDDVAPSPGVAAGHLAHHESEDHLVVVGYMPVRPDLDPGEVASSIYAAEYESRCRAHEADPASVIEHLWGGNVSFRRDDYLALPRSRLVAPPGLEDARLYHEDRELGLRFADAGAKGRFDRTLHAVHDHRRDTVGFLRDAFGRGVCDVVVHRLHPDRTSAPSPPRRVTAALAGRLVGHPDRRASLLSTLARPADLAGRVGATRAGVLAARAARRSSYALGAAAAQIALADPTFAPTAHVRPSGAEPAGSP